MKGPDFEEFANKFDIVCLTETKLDELDCVNLPDYRLLRKDRKKKRRASGGVAILVKENIVHRIQILNTEVDDTLWFTVTNIGLEKDVLFGLVYIPPQNSPYADINVFEQLENVILNKNNIDDLSVCILGDFNARSGGLCDVVVDGPSTQIDSLDIVTDENHLDNPSASSERSSCDTIVNNYGLRFLEMCKNLGLRIANGRCGNDKGVGQATCKGVSLVDYILLSSDLFEHVSTFDVFPFEMLWSDVHNAVGFTLESKHTRSETNVIANNPQTNRKMVPPRPVWSSNDVESFISNINTDQVTDICQNIAILTNSADVTADNINAIVDDTKNLLLKAASSCNMIKQTKSNRNFTNMKKRAQPSKPWFNLACEDKRKSYFRVRNQLRRRHDAESRQCVRQSGKAYKKELNKQFRLYHEAVAKKLRNLKSTNPKDYWKIINNKDACSSNPSVSAISLEVFADHFRELNRCINTEINVDIADTGVTTEQINSPFTEAEVAKVFSKLKNNKACGQDQILNEFLKNSCSVMLRLYTNLFNLVLESGVVPNDWTIGFIKPLYKNKGSVDDVDNYRGITLLSCLGKAFTSLLNNRLNLYLTETSGIGPEQAGFRSGYSTMDHVFALKALIDLYLTKKKRLYCCFIDYKKAFDTVPRLGLWRKLLDKGINGRIFTLVRNMYENAKSCVVINGCMSEYFACDIGVRQGENLSPLLFSIYLADLENFLCDKYEGLSSVNILASDLSVDNDIAIYLKLFILLYADDTVLMAESPASLQLALNAMADYCNQWGLCVNTAKSKVMICSRGKVRNIPNFVLAGTHLEVVFDYMYLGVKFNYNGKFTKAKTYVYERASRSMFALLKKASKLVLPIDIQLHLFDSVVAPVLLYGSEVWACEDLSGIEKLHLRFCKMLLKVNKSTANNMVYGELGRVPLKINATVRALCLWYKLISSEQVNKLSSILYKLLYRLDVLNVYTSDWILYLKNTLNEIGMSEFWLYQHVTGSLQWFKAAVHLRLTDQFKQKWFADVFVGGKCLNYRIFKEQFGFEIYLVRLSPRLRTSMSRFRCRNHRLPIESARDLIRHERLCTLCDLHEVGDEYHYLFKCPAFNDDRIRFIKKYYFNRPSSVKFSCLMNSSGSCLTKLALFMKIIMSNIV